MPAPAPPRLSYSRWTCRTRSALCSSSRDSRLMESGWRSLFCNECRLSSVTSHSCWELLCSCCRSCRHSLPQGSEGSGAGAGAQAHCEGNRAAPPSREHAEALGGHLTGSSTPGPGAAARVPHPWGPWDRTGSPCVPLSSARDGQATAVGSTLVDSTGARVHLLTKQGQH